jgi:hypothetical protein
MCELVGYMALVLAQGVVLRYRAPVKTPVSKRAAESIN